MKKINFIAKTLMAAALTTTMFACGDDSSSGADQCCTDLENISSSSLENSSSPSSEESSSSAEGSTIENTSSSSVEGPSSSSIEESSSSFVESSFIESSSSANITESSSSTQTDIADGESYMLRFAATYEEKDGYTFLSYYTGACVVKNDVYTWEPKHLLNTRVLELSKDSLTDFSSFNGSVLKDSYNAYKGNNSSIYGIWEDCKSSTMANRMELTKDSIVTTTYLNKEKIPALAEMGRVNELLKYTFDRTGLNYDPELKDRYRLEDIPKYGITFSNKQMTSVTMDIHGQKFEINMEDRISSKGFHALQSVESNGKTCEQKSVFSYLQDGSTCNAEHYSALYGYRDNGEHESNFTTESMEEFDIDNATFYACVFELIEKDNPIHEELK